MKVFFIHTQNMGYITATYPLKEMKVGNVSSHGSRKYTDFLVGGFNPSEKYKSKWVHLPQFRDEHKKCLKPPRVSNRAFLCESIEESANSEVHLIAGRSSGHKNDRSNLPRGNGTSPQEM